MSFYRKLATSNHFSAVLARRLYHGVNGFSVPAPAPIVVPARVAYEVSRDVAYFFRRVFIAEPLFKGYCKSYGRNLHTGISVHWVSGKGNIVVGDNVEFDGLSSIHFAVRFCDDPTLLVGNNTGISDACSFSIGKRITIGNNVRIASGVRMFDSSGHPKDSRARADGAPPEAEDVHPIVIEDHVWIGREVTIYPGVTVGEGAIIATGAVVTSSVAAFTVVAGNPARRISKLPEHPDNVKAAAEKAAAEKAASEDEEKLKVTQIG